MPKVTTCKITNIMNEVLENAKKRGIKHTKTSKQSNDNWYGNYKVTTYTFQRCAKIEITHYGQKRRYNKEIEMCLSKYSAITDCYNWNCTDEDHILNAFKKCRYYTPEKVVEVRAKNDMKRWDLAAEFGRLSDKENWIYDFTLELYKLGRNADLSDPKTEIKLKANLWTTNKGFIRGVEVDLEKKIMTSKSLGKIEFDNTDEIIQTMSKMIKNA